MPEKFESLAIGLSGCSGAGKTELIKKILENFAPDEVTSVAQDNYYIPRDRHMTDEKGVRNFDMPESIDHDLFYRDLSGLLNGKAIRFIRYPFNIPGEVSVSSTILPARIILAEGIFIYHIPEINALFKYRLFIEAGEPVMLKRRMARDQADRGYDQAEIRYRFENHVIPAYHRFILPYRDACDVIIPNGSGFSGAAEIISGFLSHLLGKTGPVSL
jgi:uridine kinase